MTEDVGVDGIDASELAGGVERGFDAGDLGSAIRDDVGLWLRLARVEPFPPPQVGEQSRRQFHGGLALGRLSVAFRMTMEHAVDGIDE